MSNRQRKPQTLKYIQLLTHTNFHGLIGFWKAEILRKIVTRCNFIGYQCLWQGGYEADALDLVLQSTFRKSHKLMALSVSSSELSPSLP